MSCREASRCSLAIAYSHRAEVLFVEGYPDRSQTKKRRQAVMVGSGLDLRCAEQCCAWRGISSPRLTSLHRRCRHPSKHAEVHFDDQLNRDGTAPEHRWLELILSHRFDRFLIESHAERMHHMHVFRITLSVDD